MRLVEFPSIVAFLNFIVCHHRFRYISLARNFILSWLFRLGSTLWKAFNRSCELRCRVDARFIWWTDTVFACFLPIGRWTLLWNDYGINIKESGCDTERSGQGQLLQVYVFWLETSDTYSLSDKFVFQRLLQCCSLLFLCFNEWIEYVTCSQPLPT